MRVLAAHLELGKDRTRAPGPENGRLDERNDDALDVGGAEREKREWGQRRERLGEWGAVVERALPIEWPCQHFQNA